MSAFLADTNVISEEAKPRPNEKVVAWMTGASKAIYISSVVVAEIHRGIADLPLSAPRRALLSAWLADKVESVYAGRILPMDVAVRQNMARADAGKENGARRLRYRRNRPRARTCARHPKHSPFPRRARTQNIQPLGPLIFSVCPVIG